MPANPATPDESIVEADAVRFVTQSSKRITVRRRLVKGPASASAIAADQAIATADAKSAAETLRDRG